MKFREDAGAKQFAGSGVVSLAKRTGEIQSFVAVAIAGSASGGEKLVRDFGHRAYDDDRRLCQPLADDADHAIDGGGIFDGSAAEFHDDHRRTWILNVRDISLDIPSPVGVLR